ncbi:MAG: hypothetical protein JW885_13790 [Deltaproteobacteria bacterium]|nr:hypothetical protein [Candidatus Zymogenaceae bacterium]
MKPYRLTRTAVVIVCGLLIAGGVSGCASIWIQEIFFPTRYVVAPWYDAAWTDLSDSIEGKRGEPYESIRSVIEEKRRIEPIFAVDVQGGSGDDRYLLSPRNTRVRPSFWDGSFRWNLAENGRNYIFHLYADGVETVTHMLPVTTHTRVEDDECQFVPGVTYSWDVTLCVVACNLRLSANPFDRPAFTVLTEEEDAAVQRWLDELASTDSGEIDSETGAALTALALECHELYLEEEEYLLEAVEIYPESIILRLILAGAYDLMKSPEQARAAFELARDLAVTDTDALSEP